MKKNSMLLILPILIFGITLSCSKDDNENSLTAKITADAFASPGDTIWLDASASTGGDYSEEWTISGPDGDINKVYDDLKMMYFFVAEKTGSYSISLRITYGSNFSDDYAIVTVSGVVKLGGSIPDYATIKDISYGLDSVDYVLSEDLVITSTGNLTIEDYVKIQIPEGISIIVEEGGHLNVANAVFTSSTSWKGIHVKGNAIFYYTEFDNGGSASFSSDATQKANVFVDETGRAGFSYCTFKNSGGYGVYYTSGGRFLAGTVSSNSNNYLIDYFTYNTFVSNASGPIHGNSDLLNNSFVSNTFTDETSGTYIEFSGGTIYESVYIYDIGLSYKVSGVLEFSSSVYIQSGVTMEFEPDAGISAIAGINIGSSSEAGDVVLKGSEDGAGYWKGIYSAASANIYNTTITGAGSIPIDDGQTQKAALYLLQGILSMENSVIQDNDGIGIVMASNAMVTTFSNNSLIDNKEGAILVAVDNVGLVTSSSNTYDPFASNSPTVTVRGASGNQSYWGTWPNLQDLYDYLVIEDIYLTSDKSLTVEAGAEIKFAAGTRFDVEGTLTAQGTLLEPIYFTGEQKTNGYWEGMSFVGNPQKTLDFVHVEYGGGDGLAGNANLIIQSSSVNVTITNSFIINSAGWGVVANNSSVSAINDVGSANTIQGDLGNYQQN